jgi:prepilin-type N-terminal cleavage/methylation domain-containing protein
VTRGYTLVELMLVLAVMAATAGVSAVAWRRPEGPLERVIRELHMARARAVETAEPVVWRSHGSIVRFLPDGSAAGGPIMLGATVVRVDPLSGVIRVGR